MFCIHVPCHFCLQHTGLNGSRWNLMGITIMKYQHICLEVWNLRPLKGFRWENCLMAQYSCFIRGYRVQSLWLYFPKTQCVSIFLLVFLHFFTVSPYLIRSAVLSSFVNNSCCRILFIFVPSTKLHFHGGTCNCKCTSKEMGFQRCCVIISDDLLLVSFACLPYM